MKPDYSDIIDLPCWEPKKHRRMSIYNRAAQFSPFAALSGFDAEIAETGRLTEREVVLDEYEARVIDRRLRSLALGDSVSIRYFKPDERKDGGSYPVAKGTVGKIDLFQHTVEIVMDKRYNQSIARADKTSEPLPTAKLPRVTIPMSSIVEIIVLRHAEKPTGDDGFSGAE